MTLWLQMFQCSNILNEFMDPIMSCETIDHNVSSSHWFKIFFASSCLCAWIINSRWAQSNIHSLSDHLIVDVRNFAARGDHSLLWPEATTFLNHLGSLFAAGGRIVVYGQRTHWFTSQKSLLNLGQIVSLAKGPDYVH